MKHVVAILFGLSVASSALLAQAPAPAAAPGIIPQVRAALNANDIPKAEALVSAFRRANGTTPEALEAFSWLGRGALAQKKLDEAERFAFDVYDLSIEALKGRKLDDEPRLPIALGAAIEVRAHVMAERGRRSEAVIFLRNEGTEFKDTSIVTRINKNVNLISLEGQPAHALTTTEWIGAARPSTLAALKGKPVVLFLWAHWCGDCKAMGPILEQAASKYKAQGLTVVAPTQRYGYVAKRQPASPADEKVYIESIRDQFYPWLASAPVPLDAENFVSYGVSTTPTLVFINRDGRVHAYHPGQMTAEELEATLRPMLAATASVR